MHDRLPLVVFPNLPGAEASDRAPSLRLTADRYLARVGSILFRGFDVNTPDHFRRFAAGFGATLDRPAAESEGPSELGHLRGAHGAWPLRAWLSAGGGQSGFTLLADGRDVFRALPRSVRARFVDRGLMQVQRIELGAGVERASVEAWCGTNGASVDWSEPGVAIARRRLPAVIAHPATHELVWLGDVRAPARTGKRLVHADGGEIEPSVLEEIEAAFDDVRSVLEWEAGDVLLLDNLIMSHLHVAAEGDRFTPRVLHGEPTFSPSREDVRWVEAPPPGPRRVDVSEGQRAQPYRSWA
jgi:TfdA family taurine catabolism dioxygenase TauD